MRLRSGLLHSHPLLRRLSLAAVDALLLTLALGLAYEVGFNFEPHRFGDVYRLQFLYVVPVLVLVRLALFTLLGLYRGFTRYTGIYELTNIVLGCVGGSLALVLFNVCSNYIPHLDGYPLYTRPGGPTHLLRVPWGIVIIDLMLAMGFIAGLRLAWRLMADQLMEMSSSDRKRVLIIGAGDEGEQLCRDLLRNFRNQFKPVAFADPDPMLRGRRIHGLPVAGNLDQLETLTQRYEVQMIMIALPKATPSLLRQLVEHCRQARLSFQIVPNLDNVIKGQVMFNQLRPVEIEDLLGRPAIVLPRRVEQSPFYERTILVTGAGGSIGSELCRQIFEYKPRRVVILGRGENSIYEIEHELAPRAAQRGIELVTRIGNVRDASLVETIFETFSIQVVLHAAAHKHVHFMEWQPGEAIKNNVAGTRVLAQAAARHRAERFIMISTDKAVRPTGVMGASKRVAEMIVSSLNDQYPDTQFISVRFGNVLGSRGSVIPLFRRQIAEGGPITVTHPDVMRYFMTIPEAVSLVLEAGSVGKGGEVFLLDMGHPVKIADLARNLITLSGLEPDKDIKIEFTGLRPGEKLFEELLTDDENRQETGHPKLFRSAQAISRWEELESKVTQLEQVAHQGNAKAIRALLMDLIPDYKPAANVPQN